MIMMRIMMIDFNTIVAIIFVILAGLFAYVSSVIVHEQKTGKPVRLFWEKKEVIKPDPLSLIHI